MKSKWTKVLLKDIATELSDGLHKAPKFVYGGEYLFVNATNLENGYIVEKDKAKRTTYEEYIKYSVPLTDRTILYSIDGTIGNIARYRGEKCVLGKGACYINLNDDVDFDYVYFQLQSRDFDEYIHTMSTGSTIRHISLRTMRNYCFNLPPLPIQRRIANILSSVDDKIENTRKTCEKLEEIAQAIFKRWFVEFEFPNEDRQPYKSSGGEMVVCDELGKEIPKGWKCVSLIEMAEFINGLALKRYPPKADDDALPVLKIKELRQGFCDSSSDKATSNVDESYIINVGDLIFSWSGSLMVRFWTNGTCFLNQHLFNVKAKNGFTNEFVYLVVKHFLEEFRLIAASKATTMGHIKRSDLKNSYFALNNKVFQQFNDIIVPIIQEKIHLELENAKLMQTRDALLPKLMSGELAVDDMEV